MTGRRLGLLAVVGLFLSGGAYGCVAASATPTPGPAATPTAPASAPATTSAGPTQTAGATASPSPSAIDLYLRFWTTYPSIGPVNSFGSVPLVISDGQLMTVEYTANARLSRLYRVPTRRALSQAGLARIVAEARDDGLLGSETSFKCPEAVSSGVVGDVQGGAGPSFLVLMVNGVGYDVTASCSSVAPTAAPGTPVPGTYAAFQRFQKLLSDPSSWLGAEVGPETAYDPDRLAVLAIPFDTSAGSPEPAQVVKWPLATPFASFGVAYAGGRCAVVTGADATALATAVKPTDITAVSRDGGGDFAQLVVRAFMPGEPDPCAGG